MRGPLPKDPAIRQRVNRSTTRATLSPDGGRRRAPPLPDRTGAQAWHKLTVAWWRDVWHSPMAAEYLEADRHTLYRLAVLVDKFWERPTTELAAEIYREQQAFGLTPIDRRRLEWIVEKAEQASERRSGKRAPAVERDGGDDPRRLFQVVS